jgi:hypothetical protein
VCVWYIVEVEVGTVYRTLAQQAGMPWWHWPRH